MIIRMAKPAILMLLLPKMTKYVQSTETDADDKFLKMFITFLDQI